jgi:anaerobic selenocysteine-containing dehydrogenase
MEVLVRQRGEALATAHRGSTFVPGFRREELRELEARGWWIPHGQGRGEFWASLRETGGWFDPYHDDLGRGAASRRPGGRVALFPEEARRRISRDLPDRSEGFLPVTSDDPAGEPELPLLIPYRVMTLASGTTPLMPWLLEKLGPMTESAWEPWVEIHPEMGRKLQLPSGQKVRVSSERGEFTARLRFFEGAQPGVINVPYGLHSRVEDWGLEETANPLAAVGNVRDPVTGLPDWYSTRVRIEAV